MSPWEKVTVAMEIGLATAILIGLLTRGHWRSGYSFVLYLAAFVALEGAILTSPGRFFRLDFWLAKEAIECLLKLAVAFTVVLQVLETFGWVARRPANFLNSFAFVSLLVFWVRCAWQPFSAADVSPAVLSFLQPWVRPRSA